MHAYSAMALILVMATWYATVLMLILEHLKLHRTNGRTCWIFRLHSTMQNGDELEKCWRALLVD